MSKAETQAPAPEKAPTPVEALKAKLERYERDKRALAQELAKVDQRREQIKNTLLVIEGRCLEVAETLKAIENPVQPEPGPAAPQEPKLALVDKPPMIANTRKPAKGRKEAKA